MQASPPSGPSGPGLAWWCKVPPEECSPALVGQSPRFVSFPRQRGLLRAFVTSSPPDPICTSKACAPAPEPAPLPVQSPRHSSDNLDTTHTRPREARTLCWSLHSRSSQDSRQRPHHPPPPCAVDALRPSPPCLSTSLEFLVRHTLGGEQLVRLQRETTRS